MAPMAQTTGNGGGGVKSCLFSAFISLLILSSFIDQSAATFRLKGSKHQKRPQPLYGTVLYGHPVVRPYYPPPPPRRPVTLVYSPPYSPPPTPSYPPPTAAPYVPPPPPPKPAYTLPSPLLPPSYQIPPPSSYQEPTQSYQEPSSYQEPTPSYPEPTPYNPELPEPTSSYPEPIQEQLPEAPNYIDEGVPNQPNPTGPPEASYGPQEAPNQELSIDFPTLFYPDKPLAALNPLVSSQYNPRPPF